MKGSRVAPAPSSRLLTPQGALRFVLLLVLGASLLSLLLLSTQTRFSGFSPFAGTSAAFRSEQGGRTNASEVLPAGGDEEELEFGDANLRLPDSNGVVPTFVLLRAVGNALPPRHDPTHTLTNLRFILEHEKLEGEERGDVVKHWVLNRIVDPAVRGQIKKLLREFGATYSEIPFRLEEYANEPFKVVVEDYGVDDVHMPHPDDEDEWPRLNRFSEVYDNKIRYALSINYARNVMIELGQRTGARWILPWDQNCFLTRDAWRQIKSTIATQEAISARMAANALAAGARNGNYQPAPTVKYLVSYMDRLTQENDEILSPNFTANPWEEPQIIFRYDAVERFDEQVRYGKRDKAALLVRLKIAGPWDEWGWSNWEFDRTYRNISHDVDGITVPSAGYVVRLFSGKGGNFEAHGNGADLWREIKRGEGVIHFLDSLEANVMRKMFEFKTQDLLVYDRARLEACSRVYQGENLTSSKSDTQTNYYTCEDDIQFVSSKVLEDASKALKLSGLLTITTNRAVDPFQHSHFFSNYYDQGAARADAEDNDGLVLRNMVYNTTSLVLAWTLTSDDKYAVKAVELLDAMFVNSTLLMAATLDYADLSIMKQLTTPTGYALGEASGIRHTATLSFLLDAIRILKYSPSSPALYTQEWLEKLDKWITTFHDVLLKQPHAQYTFRFSTGLYGLQYDLQLAALAAYHDDSVALRYTLGTVHGRFLTMISKVEELLIPLGISTAHYTLMTLSTIGQIADIASRFNMTTHMFHADITFGRKVESVNGKGGLLCRFVEKYLPCCHKMSADTSGALDSSGSCVSALQSASEGEVFIYSRITKHAVQQCPSLKQQRSCTSLAYMKKTGSGLPTEEAKRFQVPPYPFLHRQDM